MAAPTTVEEFLELVPKSGVLEPRRLHAYIEPLRAQARLPKSPAQLANLLLRDGLLTRFQVEQLLQGKFRGFTLGRYQVLELLGSGGMSAVYLCADLAHRRRVAVKVLPTQLAKDPVLLKRFYREAQATAALDHPHIVRGYEVNQENGLHFFVMEYVDGTSLQALVSQVGPMPVPRAAHYIQQAAIGLQHAHEKGLVHRDIKPGNLLVDRSGTVKILDMGLALFSANNEDSVLTKDVLGTLDYVAPEQARDSHNVDIRADIYSLGGALYFLLTAKMPLDTDGLERVLQGKAVMSPRPIRTVRRNIPEALADVVARMMAHGPEHRYQTPRDVAQALAPWTQKPIPPPTEQELPQLSPAAQVFSPNAPPGIPSPAGISLLARLQGWFGWRSPT